MDLLEELKQQYGWNKAVAINEDIVETDHGLKRIRYWEDQDLLDWHINWRDHCTIAPVVLADRMIRTKDGDSFIPWESSKVTVHDEITQSFSQSENGQVWGTLLGLMIRYGVQSKTKIDAQVIQQPDLVKLEKRLWMFPTTLHAMLQNIVYEGKIRSKKAKKLRSKYLEEHHLPLLDKVRMDGQAKHIHDMLHWAGTSTYPERGYHSIQIFLRDWLSQHHSAELHTLLDAIEDIYPEFSTAQGPFLLAECLEPYEILPILKLEPQNDSITRIEEVLHTCTVEWEQSKRMVEDLANWLDGRIVHT